MCHPCPHSPNLLLSKNGILHTFLNLNQYIIKTSHNIMHIHYIEMLDRLKILKIPWDNFKVQSCAHTDKQIIQTVASQIKATTVNFMSHDKMI